MFDLAGQGVFHRLPIGQVEAETDAAIRTQVAGHGDEPTPDVRCLDEFFRP